MALPELKHPRVVIIAGLGHPGATPLNLIQCRTRVIEVLRNLHDDQVIAVDASRHFVWRRKH